MRTALRIFCLSFLSFALLSGSRKPEPFEIHGLTMGTTYYVIYFDEAGADYRLQIDSLLQEVNRGISVYEINSSVSEFNRSRDGVIFQEPFFREALILAMRLSKETSGAFDPTVLPLVNAWGFGPEKNGISSSRKIDSLKQFVGADKIIIEGTSVRKKDSRVQLDFGGIGQGYGVDVISKFLMSKGLKNFLVEIGGEGFALGRNLSRNSEWRIGILDPAAPKENGTMNFFVSLHDQAFTTSGNYQNFRAVDGKKISHIIDPQTGFPTQNAMLSASVFAPECATADAWATAFMVMGLKGSIQELQQHSELDAILQYSSPEGLKTFVTPGIKQQLIHNK
jgi:thiamine biosynthesis lipoprotein